MTKRKLTAILLTSSVMLSIMGCSGSTSTEASTGSSEMELSEAELEQAAREAMVAVEDASNASSSEDASTAASSAVEAATAATSSEAATTADSAKTQDNSDLAEYEIMIDGEKLSILDSASTIMEKLGQYEKKDDQIKEEPSYSYGSKNISLYTFVADGEELTYDLCIYKQGAKTARNVGVGDSKDAIIAAYGDPVETFEFLEGYGIKYKFDKFTLYFDFDANTNKATDITYGNNDTITKRHTIHPDYIGD